MTGIEVAAGYFIMWAVRKARRVADAADTEVDRALDAGMERVHDLISSKIGAEPAVQQLTAATQAGNGVPDDETRQGIEAAIKEAAGEDAEFAARLEQAVRELQKAEKTTGRGPTATHGVAVGGDLTIHPDAFKSDNGSVSAFLIGEVNLGNPTNPGSGQH
ncbi:chromosome partitioning protein [Streptomyces alanosinicus]|uniref:Chromosome partitioning protein n=1 Tax=Streptomyces alanosinicus TaxID=68171 RepID=A0A918YPV0_9ACTN|nr:chromosome partitioning protein [Streptomyces alanosinicus]GHE10961.1 hypothetical protein GCM10010339_68860 [Streptomyces alanosinicus]